MTSSSASLPTTDGHINFFQDLEQVLCHLSWLVAWVYAEMCTQSSFVAAIATKKKGSSVSTDQGVPLAPSKEDLRPWYASKTGERSTEDGRKDKDDAEGKRYVFTPCAFCG